MQKREKSKKISKIWYHFEKEKTLSNSINDSSSIQPLVETFGEIWGTATFVDPLHRSVVAAYATIKEYYNITSEI
jgi:hypothetical protein